MGKVFKAVIVAIFVLTNACLSFAYEKEVKDLSASMAVDVAKSGKKKIAVVDFTDLQGSVTELGRFLAEEFSVAFAGSDRGFEVVDRTHLKTILAEYKLSATGIIDPQTAKKLGQVAGVDALITGTITPFGESIRLSIKILDTSTAKVIGATTGNIARTKAIEELLSRGIETSTTTKEPASTSTQSAKKETKAVQKVEIENFIFELQGCKMSGSVICNFMVTNNDEDRELYMGWSGINASDAKIFDDSGNEYEASNLRLGNKAGSSSVGSLLVSGIPVKASATFNNVSSQAKTIALFEFGIMRKNIFVKFRNIPLSK